MTVLSSHRSVADPGRRSGWAPARIVSAVIGVLLALCSLGLLGVGGAAWWASTTQRHGGDIDLGTWSYTGSRIWYHPQWFARHIPDPEIEGQRLARKPAQRELAAAGTRGAEWRSSAAAVPPGTGRESAATG